MSVQVETDIQGGVRYSTTRQCKKDIFNNNKYLFIKRSSEERGKTVALKNSGVADTLAKVFVRWIVCESTELILDCFG